MSFFAFVIVTYGAIVVMKPMHALALNDDDTIRTLFFAKYNELFPDINIDEEMSSTSPWTLDAVLATPRIRIEAPSTEKKPYGVTYGHVAP